MTPTPLPPIESVALSILAVDLLRYLLAAGSAWLLLNVLLRRRLAHRRVADDSPRPGQKRREIALSMLTVAIFAAVGVLVFLLAQQGTLQIVPRVAQHGWGWWWASLALIIVAHDAYFYWTHRALHHRRWFAAVHGRHHASRHPTPWAAYAFHPVEALVQAAFLPLWLAFVPTHPGVIAAFLLHMIVRNVLGHSGVEVMPWRWLRGTPLGLNTTVTHHHLHHARNRGNYGLYFTWWDRLCGTEDPQYRHYGEARFLGAGAATSRPADGSAGARA